MLAVTIFTPEFLLTSFVVVVVPGTGVIYTVSTGLALSWRSSIAAAAGCTAGILPHLAASILGLSALLHASATAFRVLKYLGCAYLLYLAWQMWRETGSLSFDSKPRHTRAGRIILRAVLINLLNPKLTLFFFAFLPQFVSTGAPPAQPGSPVVGALSATQEMLLLSAVFMAMTLVVFVLYGLLASSVRSWFARSQRATTWVQRTFALIIAGLAVKLALSRQ